MDDDEIYEDEISFDEWWNSLDDIEQEEYNQVMSEYDEDIEGEKE